VSLMTAIIHPDPGFRCGPRGLLVLTAPDFSYFRKKLSFPSRRPVFLSEVLYGGEGALAGPALGAPQAVMLLENLIAAGVRECLVYGWAGALREEVPLGELFAIEKAFSAEGTSRFYSSEEEFFPDLSDGLRAVLAELAPLRGSTVSLDAPYRETVSFCKHWGKRVEMVDMEVAALYAVARFRKIKILALLTISDRVYPRRARTPAEILRARRKELLTCLSANLD